jgi:hypothetical protein
VANGQLKAGQWLALSPLFPRKQIQCKQPLLNASLEASQWPASVNGVMAMVMLARKHSLWRKWLAWPAISQYDSAEISGGYLKAEAYLVMKCGGIQLVRLAG